jgi:group II intron reverse transcriptase/maturase
VESGQSKEKIGLNVGKMGLPKAPNGYGSRGIVLPLNYFGLYNTTKVVKSSNWKGGRILGQTLRNKSSAAGDPSTVKSDATAKLQRLGKICLEDPDYIVTDSIYKFMYNSRLYEIAYHNLKSNPGNMTPGIIPTTLDGFSSETITKIIDSLKDQTFKFNPGRRIQIPKASGGTRPLTIAPPRDKIVQEVIRMILEVIYEPTFSKKSHGFRNGKSCHTALKEIRTKFGVASWYIEGDISKCFDSFDHDLLISFLRNKIKDERFIRLIIKALKAGYFEFREYNHSILGTPQGSIISPILCNIYLDNFDKYVEQLIITFSKGSKARPNPLWISYNNKKRRSHTNTDKIKWHKLMLSVPSKDPIDPNFKKLVYVRYADDWIVGVRGSFEDCQSILEQLRVFLRDNLKLTLSDPSEKTFITNARQGRALFLGTRIGRGLHQTFNYSLGSFARRNNRDIRLEVPLDRIHKKLNDIGFLKDRTPIPRFLWLHNSKDQIISLYNSVYRGYLNYYSFAMNKNQLSSYLHFVLKTSCAKLLAAKFTLDTQNKVHLEFGKDLKGKDKIGFIVAEYGLTPWDFKTPSVTRSPRNKISESGILNTLYAETTSVASLENLSCSNCGSKYRVEMHHVKYLKDLNPKLSKIDALMAKRRRKQLPLCRECHLSHHSSAPKNLGKVTN